MKKIITFAIVICFLLSGCSSENIAGDVDTGDINVGDIDTGDINVGDIDAGIYIKTESDDIYSIEWEYGNQSSGCLDASGKALEKGVWLLLTEDIVKEAGREGAVDFTVTAKKKNGELFGEGSFTYEQATKRMELTVMQDGTIRE